VLRLRSAIFWPDQLANRCRRSLRTRSAFQIFPEIFEVVHCLPDEKLAIGLATAVDPSFEIEQIVLDISSGKFLETLSSWVSHKVKIEKTPNIENSSGAISL
jgi:hypothetical protein